MNLVDSQTSNKMANMAFVCAVFVVIMHIVPRPSEGVGWWLVQFGRGFLCRIAVPYFFLAAGYFLSAHFREERWWGKELKKRVRSLLVPFFVFNFLYLFNDLLISVAAVIARGGSIADIDLLNLDVSLRCFGLNFFRTPYLGPLWFVRNLFLLVLCAPMLEWALKGRIRGSVTLILLFFLYGAFRPFTGEFPFRCTSTILCYGFSLEGLFYFAVGLFLRMNKVEIHLGIGMGCLCAIAALSLFGMKIFSMMHGHIWQYYAWLSIPFCLLACWFCVPTAKWSPWIVGCSFPMFLIHMFFVRYVAYIFPCGETGGYLLRIVFVVVASVVCTICIKKLSRGFQGRSSADGRKEIWFCNPTNLNK